MLLTPGFCFSDSNLEVHFYHITKVVLSHFVAVVDESVSGLLYVHFPPQLCSRQSLIYVCRQSISSAIEELQEQFWLSR